MVEHIYGFPSVSSLVSNVIIKVPLVIKLRLYLRFGETVYPVEVVLGIAVSIPIPAPVIAFYPTIGIERTSVRIKLSSTGIHDRLLLRLYDLRLLYDRLLHTLILWILHLLDLLLVLYLLLLLCLCL